jgi:hypothetical protein
MPDFLLQETLKAVLPFVAHPQAWMENHPGFLVAVSGLPGNGNETGCGVF